MEYEFFDGSWVALQTDLRMVEYWEILKRNGISKESGEEFLNDAWEACAAEEVLEVGRDYFNMWEDGQAIWTRIQSFQQKYHVLPAWLKLDGEPEECTPAIYAAFSSQKSNFALERGRHLVVKAKERFQQPFYECVAIAVNVALGLEEDDALDARNLKNSYLRVR